MDRLDPQMRAVLDQVRAGRGGVDRYALPFAAARQQLLDEREPWLEDGPPCETKVVALDLPSGRISAVQVLPGAIREHRLLLYLHGGGWCVGSSRTHDNIVRRLADAAACEAWSIDYSLAPESPFPHALHEVRAVVAMVRAQHPDHRIALAGDSAGANMALAACLLGADIDALILFYGVYEEDLDDPGMQALGDGRFGLSIAAQRRYLENYLGDATGASDERAASFPLTWGAGLAHLPPVWMTIASHDILAGQNRRMADALRAANVSVTVDAVDGVTHGFLSYARALPAAALALQRAGTWWATDAGT
jgi:acetyl esterase